MRVLSMHARANRSRWEILRDVLEACNGNGGVCLTAIMRKANLNSLYAAHCIDILVKSNLLRVVDEPMGNPIHNNNARIYRRYVKTPEGKAFIDLFDRIQKMLVNGNEDPNDSLARVTPKRFMSFLPSPYFFGKRSYLK